ncbi:hypothetical protein RSOLAG1IB_09427 [Rhizoctonia solani AG-1 IB]|uniref:Uncharacterized protein n=1 Tax=Thanatephorus cucumeris (strain AG1-IB / isolate 7/3/14) TaxID=1108050 RepID=A0A0B7FTJ5_THACB|nr:hypothetical protein RSOLAG1IB_09427 [Rhizoctonia solani AG-1 IB]
MDRDSRRMVVEFRLVILALIIPVEISEQVLKTSALVGLTPPETTNFRGDFYKLLFLQARRPYKATNN